MKPILSISNIHAGYNDKPILEGVTLHVNKGEVVALLGHNGAGKTTLLKTIFGLLIPSEGKIEADGKIVYVPQGMRVFPNLTVKENILIVSDEKVVPEHIFELFPVLKHKEHNHAGNLSGGEQQMVALARAIIQTPDILLLDEPSLGLSPKLVKEVFEILETLREKYNYTILVVEHNILSLSKILSRAYVLEKGEVKTEITDMKHLGKEIV
jgi:branched-chain amino acid transport system ATP-binding protein